MRSWGLSVDEQEELWARWRRGESLRLVARQMGKCGPSIRAFVLQTGGVQQRPPQRAARSLTAAEREEISRGVAAGEDRQQRWLPLPTARDPLLEAVDLHGAHDFRHTFATWLEDAGIPALVIDEVMGHEATSRAGQQRGSAMGAHYRHTTLEMAGRIAAAIEQHLTVVLEVAEQGP